MQISLTPQTTSFSLDYTYFWVQSRGEENNENLWRKVSANTPCSCFNEALNRYPRVQIWKNQLEVSEPLEVPELINVVWEVLTNITYKNNYCKKNIFHLECLLMAYTSSTCYKYLSHCKLKLVKKKFDQTSVHRQLYYFQPLVLGYNAITLTNSSNFKPCRHHWMQDLIMKG